MRLRPSAAYGPAVTIGDMASITDAAEGFPEGAHVLVVPPEDAPWGADWYGLALIVQDESVLMPVVGEWPLGPGRYTLPEDLEAVTPADLLPALRSIATGIRNPGDLDSSFEAANQSMERILTVALAYLAAEQSDLLAKADPGDGVLLCEVGMESDGSPIVWVESDDMHRVGMPTDVVETLRSSEPLLMVAHSRDDYEMDEGIVPTVILSPLNNDEQGTSMEGTVPSPVEILRILGRRPEDDVSA